MFHQLKLMHIAKARSDYSAAPAEEPTSWEPESKTASSSAGGVPLVEAQTNVVGLSIAGVSTVSSGGNMGKLPWVINVAVVYGSKSRRIINKEKGARHKRAPLVF